MNDSVDDQVTFTIFTPTYNREKLLPRLYESLCKQTFKDFEWLIVDDGSIDDTKYLIHKYINEASFVIRYIWKPNGGKHTAINKGVSEAKGKFFSIMDSDDWYIENALEIMLENWNKIDINSQKKFCGVTGLYKSTDGNVLSFKFPKDIFDSNDLDIDYVHQIKGDKIGFKRIEVMKEFPFPEDLGSFVTESIVWNRIGKKYSNRFINKVLAVAEYQSGGLTDAGRTHAIKNPRARVVFLSELLNSGTKLPIKVRFKSAVNLFRYACYSNIPLKEIYNMIPSKVLFLTSIPFTVTLMVRDIPILYKKHNNIL